MNSDGAGAGAVVKVGGSLLDWPALPQRLGAYLASRRDHRLVLLAGGGRATDVIRELDRVHGLGDIAAHDLALCSLDLTARVLTTIVPALIVVERLERLAETWQAGLVPVAAATAIVGQVEAESNRRLPRSWDVTSDSIAALLARHLGCAELVLVKSAPLPPATDRRRAAALGLVDPYFLEAARGVDRVGYLNLRDASAATDPQWL